MITYARVVRVTKYFTPCEIYMDIRLYKQCVTDLLLRKKLGEIQ